MQILALDCICWELHLSCFISSNCAIDVIHWKTVFHCSSRETSILISFIIMNCFNNCYTPFPWLPVWKSKRKWNPNLLNRNITTLPNWFKCRKILCYNKSTQDKTRRYCWSATLTAKNSIIQISKIFSKIVITIKQKPIYCTKY